jgi:hypothetical protein
MRAEAETTKEEAGMDVLCVGMYRSGSTWQYAVVSHLIEYHRRGWRLGFVVGEQYQPTGDWRCLKAHEGHAHFAEALRTGRARAVYVYRDLRDVAFSLAHVYRTSFEDIVERQRYLHLCLANDDYWTRQPGVLAQSYEQLVGNPAGAVTAIAAHLGIPLEDGEALSIAAQHSLAASRQRATVWEQTVRARGIDPGDPAHGLLPEQHTLLHWNHIRDGQVGGWRQQATVAQCVKLALICGPWLKSHGYEPDDSWAVAGLGVVDRLTEEVESLRQQHIDQEAHLRQTARELHAAEQRLLTLERLGPVALHLAAAFHAFSLRFPRTRELCKRLLGLRTERSGPPLGVPSWDA